MEDSIRSFERDPLASEAFAEEERRLDAALARLERALEDARGLHERIEDAYSETKREHARNRGELDPTEQFQNELALKEVDRRAVWARDSAARLAKLLASPYFARVDFIPADRAQADSSPAGSPRRDRSRGRSPVGDEHYIGRFSFSDEDGALVSDWRSPVAALFYDFEPGDASYEAPMGSIRGKLALKRQIRIEDGKLESAVDADSSVRDEVLALELSRTSSNAMRSIIASIQKEQNALIRDEAPGTLVIQGVAGSGKTSIALHRIAYLLYRRKGRLNSRSVAVVSPNRVFGDYVSHVLPELGEEPVRQWSLHGIAQQALGDCVEIEAPRPAVDDVDEAHRARAARKGSLAFAEALRAFLKHVPDELFCGCDLAFGNMVVEGDWLEGRYRGYGGVAVEERIALLASDVMRDLETGLLGRDRFALPTRGALRRKLSGMLRAKDAVALYRLFLREQGWADAFARPSKRALEWEDACPTALCASVFSTILPFEGVEHVTVDEVQDVSPVQHLMLARFFGCEKTLLGDFNQALDDANGMRLGDMRSFYPDARVVELVRSYRSTCEIAALAQRVRPVAGLVCVERHGEKPRIVACSDTADVLARVREIVAAFEKSGRSTLGIVCKTDDLARRYHELLVSGAALPHPLDDGIEGASAALPPIQLLAPDCEEYAGGVSVASVTMAKGLEFDEAVVLDADGRLYASDFDRNLLYVAVTRALHKLTLLHRGTPPSYLEGL